MIRSKLLYPSKGNEGGIESFAGKVFLSISQSDRMSLLCLMYKVAKMAATAKVTIKAIDYLRLKSTLYNGLNMPAVIRLK